MRSFLATILISFLFSGAALAQEGRLTIELNKLEDAESGACQAFFLFRNDRADGFEEFEMSLAILDPSGVIDQLLTIDAAPLPPARTTLKLFEIPAAGCGQISEVLLHAIDACKPQNSEPIDCFAVIDLVSRADARLVK